MKRVSAALTGILLFFLCTANVWASEEMPPRFSSSQYSISSVSVKTSESSTDTSTRLLPERKKSALQPRPANPSKDEYEIVSKKTPVDGIPAAKLARFEREGNLYEHLLENVPLNRRGFIYEKDGVLQIEYVDLSVTKKAVNAAVASFKGTDSHPIAYVKAFYTVSQWNRIIKEIEAVPSVKANQDSVFTYIPWRDEYIRVQLTRDIPNVEKDILALGYGDKVRVDVEALRKPVDTPAD